MGFLSELTQLTDKSCGGSFPGAGLGTHCGSDDMCLAGLRNTVSSASFSLFGAGRFISIPHSVSLLCAGGAAGDLFRLEAFDQEKVHLKHGL